MEKGEIVLPSSKHSALNFKFAETMELCLHAWTSLFPAFEKSFPSAAKKPLQLVWSHAPTA